MASTTGPDPARSRRFRPPGSVVLFGCAVLFGGLIVAGVSIVGTAPLTGDEVAAVASPEATQVVPEAPQVVPEAPQVVPEATGVVPEATDHLDVEVVWPSAFRDQGSADPAARDAAEPAGQELSTAAVQRRLRARKYLVGPADGSEGQQTQAAVMAFQRVHGLEVDGVVGPVTTAALDGEPIEPTLRGGPDDRIEVDLDLQLLHLVEGGVRIATLHVSSGNGTEYVASSGNRVRANTPIGEFEIERRIRGVRHANLGVLHDPLYFHRGFAIHGSPSVPVAPASLGCVRITIADGSWLIDRVPDGRPVHLYGGEHVYTPPGQ